MTGRLELRNWQLIFNSSLNVYKITETKEKSCRDIEDSDQVFMECNYRVAVLLTQ